MAGQRRAIGRRGQIGLAVVVLVIGAGAQVLPDAMELLVAHARHVGASSITVFHCDTGDHHKSVDGARELFKRGIAAQIYELNGSQSDKWPFKKLIQLLLPGVRSLAIAVQADCLDSVPLLSQASELGYVRRQHHWLIIGKFKGDTEQSEDEGITMSNATTNFTDLMESSENATDILEHNPEDTNHEGRSVFTHITHLYSQVFLLLVARMDTSRQLFSEKFRMVTFGSDVSWLQALPLLLDSDIRVARPSPSGDGLWELRGVYRIAAGRPLTVEEPVTWAPGQPLEPLPPRIDLNGTTLRTGIVVVEDAWVNHDNIGFRHLNTWSKLNYALVRSLRQKMNFIVEPVFTNSWGYLVNGSFSGLVLLLQKGVVDIGGGGLAIKRSRIEAVDYTAETTPFHPKFLFRQPRLSAVSNVYTLPFSPTVWAVYLGSALALTAVLVATQRVLSVHIKEDDGPLPTWGDALLFACGIICDEGYPQNPTGLSSRIVLLALLLLSVFHVTSYSACIVSLLQAPSSGYDTLEQLIDSPLRIAMYDIVYNVVYGSTTTDPLVTKFWRERITSKPREQVFLPLEEGVALVRKGMFAFHADQSAYKVVAETFLEDEKCGLKTVAMFPWSVISIPVPKGSPHREIIRVVLRWMRETGLIKREILRWTTQKPTCQNMESTFVSVGLTEFRPAISILVIGLAASGAFLVLEILAAKTIPHLQRFCSAFSRRTQKPAVVHGLTAHTRHGPLARKPIKGVHVQFLN